jgi:hypothetical protein
MTDEYPSGPDLSKYFPPLKRANVPLPAAFDDRCQKCSAQMERMPCVYATEVPPFATFQCPGCKTRLLLYETPGAPLFIWTGDPGIANRKDLELRIAEHEEKVRKRALRAQQPSTAVQ